MFNVGSQGKKSSQVDKLTRAAEKRRGVGSGTVEIIQLSGLLLPSPPSRTSLYVGMISMVKSGWGKEGIKGQKGHTPVLYDEIEFILLVSLNGRFVVVLRRHYCTKQHEM